MSNYSFEIIKKQDDYLHFRLHSCKEGVYNNCVVTMDHKEQTATIYWPNGNGINSAGYFTRSQSINRSTTMITNQELLMILRYKLYKQFVDDKFMNFDSISSETNIYNYLSLDEQISTYFLKLDEWYEDIEKRKKIPRYMWNKMMNGNIEIKLFDSNHKLFTKYSLDRNCVYVEDDSLFIYNGLVIYGYNNIDNKELFDRHLSIDDNKKIMVKFNNRIWNSDFIPREFFKSTDDIFFDTRPAVEVDEIFKTILISVCDKVLKGIC